MAGHLFRILVNKHFAQVQINFSLCCLFQVIESWHQVLSALCVPFNTAPIKLNTVSRGVFTIKCVWEVQGCIVFNRNALL